MKKKKWFSKKLYCKKGFTLIEILAAVIITSLLLFSLRYILSENKKNTSEVLRKTGELNEVIYLFERIEKDMYSINPVINYFKCLSDKNKTMVVMVSDIIKRNIPENSGIKLVGYKSKYDYNTDKYIIIRIEEEVDFKELYKKKISDIFTGKGYVISNNIKNFKFEIIENGKSTDKWDSIDKKRLCNAVKMTVQTVKTEEKIEKIIKLTE